MGSTQVDLLDIVHVKVWFLAALKMCIRAGLGKFAWSTLFVQCERGPEIGYSYKILHFYPIILKLGQNYLNINLIGQKLWTVY